MIVINKNTTTNFVATLFELSQLTDPNYLFEFESDQTKTKYYTIIADISTNKLRYNVIKVKKAKVPLTAIM